MLKNVLLIGCGCAMFLLVCTNTATAQGSDFKLFATARTNDGSAILRYAPGLPPNPTLGFFEEVLLADTTLRFDMETDGQALFTIDQLPSGRRRLAKYSTDGDFLEEIADVSSIDLDSNLIYQAGQFYVTDVGRRLYRINPGSGPVEIGDRVAGAGLDAFPGGFVTTEASGFRILDDSGNLLSSMDLGGLTFDSVAIDDANRIAYISNLSATWAVVDFSNVTQPMVLNHGTGADGLFLGDFDPVTGHIFGSSLGVLSELKPDGTLATRYFGGPFGFKHGVAVVHIPEPTNPVSLMFMICLSFARKKGVRTLFYRL